MCAKVSTAVRSLQHDPKYQSKILFLVTEVKTDAIVEEIKGWEGLGDHGLVGTNRGVMKVMIPGHKFGRTEIMAKADELLAQAQ